jgi:ammonium transporter Rh
MNTVLAIGGSCIGAASVARVLFGKLEMEIMLNATLAGGVAIGSSADICTEPWEAMLIGYVGGIISAVGFQKIGPFLSEHINLQDSCGVHSLHGMPGVLAGLISAIAIAAIDPSNFPEGYFPVMANGGSAQGQAAAQIWALLVTLTISILGGISGGYIASMSMWQPVHSLFRDDDHFWEVVPKYPASYLVGGDEVYDEAKASFEQVKNALIKQRKELEVQDGENAIDMLVS